MRADWVDPFLMQIARYVCSALKSCTCVLDVIFLRGRNIIPASSPLASRWPLFWKGCLRWNAWSCAKAESKLCIFAVRPCSFVSGLIVALEELLHLLIQAYMHTDYFFFFLYSCLHLHTPVYTQDFVIHPVFSLLGHVIHCWHMLPFLNLIIPSMGFVFRLFISFSFYTFRLKLNQMGLHGVCYSIHSREVSPHSVPG